MRLLRLLRYRVRALLRGAELDSRMDEEMRFHLDMVAREYEAAGWSAAEARRRARIDFGGLQRKKEETRDARGVGWLEDLARDVRYGLRTLRRSPMFATVAVLSLGLGVGANTAVFSLMHAILLSSLPVPNPQQLRVINWTAVNKPMPISISGRYTARPGEHMAVGDAVSYPVFSAVRERSAGRARVFGFAGLPETTVQRTGTSFMGNGLMVSGDFFDGLEVAPALGRAFTPSDPEAEAAGWVVVSHAWWVNRLGADPGVLGTSLTLNGRPFTIIGVLPVGVRGLYAGDVVDFYVSTAAQPELMPYWLRSANDRWWIVMMARLARGTSDAQFRQVAQAAFVAAAGDRLEEPGLIVEDGRGGLRSERDAYQRPLLILLGIVGIVILAACANLAGLSLARGVARQHEFAIRPALGAGRGRLFRQSLTESLLLGLLGAAVGVAVAFFTQASLSRLLAGSTDGLRYDSALDPRVLTFTLALAIVAAALSGLLPAVRASRAEPISGLQSRRLRGWSRLRTVRGLVVAQMALSILLLVGAGLYGRTLLNLVRIDPGFRTDHLLLFRLDPGSAGYGEDRRTAFYGDVTESLSRIPGVRSVAFTQFALLSGWMSGGGFFTLPDHPTEGNTPPLAHRLTVSEPYFGTMGIPILLGRGFERADDQGARKVVLVNQTFVRRYLPDGSPLGQRLHADGADWTIVGVTRDAAYTGITADIPPTVFFSFRQHLLPAGFFVLRTAAAPLGLVEAARRAVAAVDPLVPLSHVETQVQIRDRAISQERLFAYLCGTLAGLALLLCCIGLYGLMAYDVTRRTGEIGVRVALGATRGQVVAPILRQAFRLTLIGALVGVPMALATVRLIRSQLYGVGPYDVTTLVAGTLLLVAVALLAAGPPARRAARTDPADALRSE